VSAGEVKLEGEYLPGNVPPAETFRERGEAVIAWCWLLIIDTLMKVLGFELLLRLVRSWPILSPRRHDIAVARRISAAVDRAATHYFKRAWCLQRSATNVCLLRLRGLNAELVIGARKLPFAAHAWAEVDGEVIDNHPIVRERFAVLDRF
jgi:transglutaminase superfamily protein